MNKICYVQWLNPQSYVLYSVVAFQIMLSEVICHQIHLWSQVMCAECCAVIMFKSTIESHMLVYKRAV